MAGSYDHVMSGWSLIENMGDAYEAVEELLWLVQEGLGTEKACELLNNKYCPMRRGDIDPDDTYKDVIGRMKR